VSHRICRLGHCLAAVFAIALFGIMVEQAVAQPMEPVLALVKKERQPLLDTLKELVSIETGSRDLEGLDRAADLIAGRLRSLGGKVELVDPSEGAWERRRVRRGRFDRAAPLPSRAPDHGCVAEERPAVSEVRHRATRVPIIRASGFSGDN